MMSKLKALEDSLHDLELEMEIANEGLGKSLADGLKKMNDRVVENERRKDEANKQRIERLKEKHPGYAAAWDKHDAKMAEKEAKKGISQTKDEKSNGNNVEKEMHEAYKDIPKELTVTLGGVKKTLKLDFWTGRDTKSNEEFYVEPEKVKKQISDFVKSHAVKFKQDEKKIVKGIISSWLTYYGDEERDTNISEYKTLVSIWGCDPNGITIIPPNDTHDKVMILVELNFDGDSTDDDSYFLRWYNGKWDTKVVSHEGNLRNV